RWGVLQNRRRPPLSAGAGGGPGGGALLARPLAYAASVFSPLRNTCVIWPRIETAISAGDTAPIERPIGPWIRPRSASVKPISLRRPQRAAWVRFEPSAPM